jgi:ABC-2 type transport system permease protein
MSWTTVAKKDFQDAARSRRLLALVAVFVLFVAGASYFFIKLTSAIDEQGAEQLGVLLALSTPVGTFFPLIGILTGYRSVIGERESGSLKLLLSLPHTRTDVVVGKFAGRTAVVSLAAIVGFLVGGGVILALGAPLPAVDYFAFVALALVLGAAFVSVGVGLSAGFSSENVVVIGGFGLVILFTMLWNVLTFTLALALQSFGIGSESFRDGMVSFISALNPQQAFNLAFSTVASVDPNRAVDGFWQQGWFGFLVLGLWVVLPLAFGRWRFSRAQLA